MKSFKKIAMLLCVVTGVVAFWLMPNINQATDVRYTRLYEDTEVKQLPNDSIRAKLRKNPKTHVNKKAKTYKHESISSSAKIKSIRPSMFSRAVQFRPAKEIVIDSLNESASADSARAIQ
ncbi:MAG TPA: hypothetical protein VIM65_20175 [Cyclobacteriaceae bacterium]